MILLLLGALGIAALMMAAKGSSDSAAKKKALVSSSFQRAAAHNLLKYVRGGGKRAETIKAYQGQIGAHQTGIADAQTKARIEKILGYRVSWVEVPKKPVISTVTPAGLPKEALPKPSPPGHEVGPLESLVAALAGQKSAPVAKPATVSKPTTVSKPATTAAKPVTVAKPAATIAKPVTVAKPKPVAKPQDEDEDAADAAHELDDYLATKPPTLNGLNRVTVRALQARIGVAADGVPGPKTAKKASELLLRPVSWPIINAANDLHTYYAVNRGRDKATIAGYQKLMCELVADGLVGPKTKARYTSLTGKDF
jgi:hypothetical protein